MTVSIFIPTTITTTSVAEMRREELIFHYLLGGSFDYWSDQLEVESSLEWTEERMFRLSFSAINIIIIFFTKFN